MVYFLQSDETAQRIATAVLLGQCTLKHELQKGQRIKHRNRFNDLNLNYYPSKRKPEGREDMSMKTGRMKKKGREKKIYLQTAGGRTAAGMI